MKNKREIDILIKDFPELQIPSIYDIEPQKIRAVLELPYWSIPKYRKFLSIKMFNVGIERIIKVLSLPNWQESRYSALICSNMWDRLPEEIEEILNMKYWKNSLYRPLMGATLWKSSPKEIDEILSLEKWHYQKYQHMLTPSVFRSSKENILAILNSPYYDKYPHLFTSTVFDLSIDQIEEAIKLFEQYNIVYHIPKSLLRRNVKELKVLFKIMEQRKYPFLYFHPTKIYQISPLLTCTKEKLKSKYNIDLEKEIEFMDFLEDIFSASQKA